MVEKHDIDTEWFRLFMTVVIGVLVGAGVAQVVHSLPIIFVSAAISGGIVLGLLSAYDP